MIIVIIEKKKKYGPEITPYLDTFQAVGKTANKTRRTEFCNVKLGKKKTSSLIYVYLTTVLFYLKRSLKLEKKTLLNLRACQVTQEDWKRDEKLYKKT